VEKAGGVINKIWNDAPSQIKLAKILVGKHELREALGASIKRSVDMEDASKIGLPREPPPN
jgi:hypothetical protein